MKLKIYKMKDYFQYLDKKHNEAIKAIKHMINVDAQEYPEYKEAATLCKFFFEYDRNYSLVYKPEDYGSFYDCAQDLETLFHTIYHALTDDGDISFIQVNKHTPTIVFECRWELTLEKLLSKEEKAFVERFNDFKLKHNINQPPTQHTLIFFNNAYEYIEAVKKNDIETEENHKKTKEILKNLKKK